MRRVALCIVAWLAGWVGLAAEEKTAAQIEAEKWAAEDALDEERMGQTDTAISAIGRIELAAREWSTDDLREIRTVDAGVFHATQLLRRQGWVERSASLPVRFANAALLTWLRQNSGLKTVHAQGRLRVDGKYFLIEDCRPADERPIATPPAGRSKRGGM